MADYIAQSRSNYFRVRNARSYRRFAARYNLTVIHTEQHGKHRYGFLSEESIPTGRADAKGEWIETDFLQELSRQLTRGDVAVVMEIGSEKQRYLIGYAAAIDARGRRIQVALSDIYRRCEETFGVTPTLVEY
ncbi:MAG: hypothetical protein PCFJNLEI_01632 [Verrucomicrobiae bacterium]|nr:hypothetical protein [Verrucomicrobiae bacterium]